MTRVKNDGANKSDGFMIVPKNSSRCILLYMRSPYRIAALLSALAVFASSLATSGFACSLHVSGQEMAGMEMAAMHTGSSDASQNSEREQRCPLPGSPVGCESMISCAPSGVVSRRSSLDSATPTATRVVATVFLQPHSETKAPELPPPRA